MTAPLQPAAQAEIPKGLLKLHASAHYYATMQGASYSEGYQLPQDTEDLFEEESQSQSFSGHRNAFQWQLFDGRQWLPVNNDHVIEIHYCQPGAQGIRLNTKDYGPIFIDFDKMKIKRSRFNIRRQTFLSSDESQQIGWYYNDNRRWHEYGSQGPSSLQASVSSNEVEQQYSVTPQGTFPFTVGNTPYRMDFTAMTQTNLTTGMSRKVRRRPKFNCINTTNSSPGVSTQSSLIGEGREWQFQGNEGVWTDYSSPRCSVASAEIERQYQQNPQGQVTFTSGRFRYSLDFAGMFQTNIDTGTQRAVRRIQVAATPTVRLPTFTNPVLPTAIAPTPPTAAPADHAWEFMADEGVWTEYRIPSCSLDSAAIENLYQLNPHGQATFTAGRYNYTLDFTGMFQTNVTFGTKRMVRRVPKVSPQLTSLNPQGQWQFKDVNGAWRDYSGGGCSVSGQDIETEFQQNPSGTMTFSTGSFNYELDFSAMTQRNLLTQTARPVRRL